jgi:hypothetical protein
MHAFDYLESAILLRTYARNTHDTLTHRNDLTHASRCDGL